MANPQQLTPEQWQNKIKGMRENPEAARHIDVRTAELQEKQNAVTDMRMARDAAVGNYGTALGVAAKGIEGGLVQNAGDAFGGLLRAGTWAEQSAEAANRAGAMAEARNGQARAAIMDEAGKAADSMNLQNTARTQEMTDAAIGQANAFESGMQGIDSSGIEGSANMERNLRYGQSRADAGEQLQYDMMNTEAQGLADGMANSFSDLSRNKAGAMNAAWGDTLGGLNAGLTSHYGETGRQTMETQPSPQDKMNMYAEAEAIAGANPNELPSPGGQTGGSDTEYMTEKDYNDRYGEIPPPRGTDIPAPEAAVQPAPDPNAAVQPAPDPNAAAPAAADPNAGMMANYQQLHDYLAGGVRQNESLDQVMSGMELTPEMKAAIQDATGAGQDKKVWRDRLWGAMGLSGKRTMGSHL